MTQGSIPRQLLRFSVPLILGNLFQLSYNMVDTIVIGRFAGSAEEPMLEKWRFMSHFR